MKIGRNLFIASAFVLGAASLAAVTPEEYYQQGCDFYAKGNMVEARKAFEASAKGGNAMSQVCFANFLKKEGKLKSGNHGHFTLRSSVTVVKFSAGIA